MGKNKDLTAAEKAQIGRMLAAGSPILEIARQLQRDHRTIKRFTSDISRKRQRQPQRGFRRVTSREVTALKREVARAPLSSSREIFERAGVASVPKTSRCRILAAVAQHCKAPAKSSLTAAHRQKRLEWARANLKTDFSSVLFTDETRATLDGPDGWARGWKPKTGWTADRRRRQQGGGGVMLWAGIINSSVVGPFMVPDGVKITAASYCDFLEGNFSPWFASQKAAFRRKMVFMHDNAPSHAARLTTQFLADRGFKNSRMMTWPASSPDLNPIENLWSLVKRRIYAGGRQFDSKAELWQAIQTEFRRLKPAEVRKLTASMYSRLVMVLQRKGGHTGM
jgi:transposase